MISLIINADDFGYSRAYNDEILKLIKKEIVKSTTVMVGRIDKTQEDQVKELSDLHRGMEIGVGVHFELSGNAGTFDDQLSDQYGRFVSIFNFKPSHVDLHKPEAGGQAAMEAVVRFSERKHVTVRNLGIGTSAKTTTSNLVILRLPFEKIKAFLDAMKDGCSYELITHPGRYDPESKSSVNKERENDVENLLLVAEYLKTRKDVKNTSYLDL
jgi:chitin disaccharide deacetylase